MNAPDSNHENPVDGLVDVHGAPSETVQPTPTAPIQQLQLVPHGNGSANVTGLGVSGDVLYSSSEVGMIGSTVCSNPKNVGMIGSTVSSNPKPSKKRSSCNNRRSDGSKKRFIWDKEPHQCFLDSYNRLPEDKRVPKKITADMRKAGCDVTRENVASHLQKHRLNLRGRENINRNRGRPSSTSVPPNEEINSQTFHNGTSNSTYPNAVQNFQQSHFISTNPDFQSHSFSINPNSQLPIQRSPNSTNPNSYLPIPNSPISNNPNSYLPIPNSPISNNPNSYLPIPNSPISNNPNSYLPIPNSPITTNPNSYLPIPNSLISTNPNSSIPPQSPSFSNSLNSQSQYLTNIPNSHPPNQSHSISINCYSDLPAQSPSFSNSPSSQSHSFPTIHNSQFPLVVPMVNQILSPFVQTRLYDPDMLQSSYVVPYNDLSILEEPNISDVSFGVTGQSSNAAINGDFFVMANHFPLPIASNSQLVSNIDEFSNAIHPTLASSLGDLRGNDYSLGAPPNSYDYNMNRNSDQNVQVEYGLNNMNVNLQFNNSFNSDVANDLQVNDLNQGLQSNLCPPGDDQVDIKPSLPQNLGSHLRR